MGKNEIISKWIDIFTEDMETATILFSKKKYLQSLFFCQQALEKALKAFYIKQFDDNYPYIHNLLDLAKINKINDKNILELFLDINPFYIEARYVTYKDGLRKLCSKKFTSEKLEKTKEVLKWLEGKLKY